MISIDNARMAGLVKPHRSFGTPRQAPVMGCAGCFHPPLGYPEPGSTAQQGEAAMCAKRTGSIEDLAVVGMEACLSAHFVSRTLRGMGFEPRTIPAIYVKPFNTGQKNNYNDAEAIAEAALRSNLRTVSENDQNQLVERQPTCPPYCLTRVCSRELVVVASRYRLLASPHLEGRREAMPSTSKLPNQCVSAVGQMCSTRRRAPEGRSPPASP